MNKQDKDLLNKLDAIQCTTALLDQALAEILDVSTSYLSQIRRRIEVSSAIRIKIRCLIKTLKMYQRGKSIPIFKRHLGESMADFRVRRKKLIKSFKSAFEVILNTVDHKE